MKVKILSGKLHRGTEEAAGYDIYSTEDIEMHPGEDRAVSTGLVMAIPKGYYGKIESRSGLSFKHGLEAGAGIIDSDYRGEVKIRLYHFGDETVELPKGTRIAQIIFMKHEEVEFEEVALLDQTDRAAKGFGSTGK